MEKRENHLNNIRTIYEKPTANIILNGERIVSVPLDQEQSKAVTFPLLSNIVLKVLTRKIREEKEIKSSKLNRKK